MTAPRLLSNDEFAHVVHYAPLVAIDVIVKDRDQNVLVGLRTNEPAKGKYFVPGGRIRKNETLAAAFSRILNTEIGLKSSRSEAKFIGVFEHFYETNAFRHADYGAHYIVLVHELNLTYRPPILGDSQHTDFRWMSAAEILSAADVHPDTQGYFRPVASL
jgi:colanic acid biosynthesis protein WcaH